MAPVSTRTLRARCVHRHHPPRPPASIPACAALHVPLCDSAGRVGVQPAAELRHVQRHEDARHVSGAPPTRVPCPPVSDRILGARCVHRHRPPRPRASIPGSRAPWSRPRVSLSIYLSIPVSRVVTRQDATAFNQPLTFDTSSVTDMSQMFNVGPPPPHACRAKCPVGSSVHTLRAPPPPPHTFAFAPPTPRVALLMRLECASAASVGVQPAAELRHVRRHGRASHVSGAPPSRVPCPVSSQLLRARCVHRHRLHTPSRPLCRPPHVPWCDLAGGAIHLLGHARPFRCAHAPRTCRAP